MKGYFSTTVETMSENRVDSFMRKVKRGYDGKPCQSQEDFLNIFWAKMGKERGQPLTDIEKAWNVPTESLNYSQYDCKD